MWAYKSGLVHHQHSSPTYKTQIHLLHHQQVGRGNYVLHHNRSYIYAHNFKLVQLSAIEIKLYMIQFFWLCHSMNFNESGLKMVRINVGNFFNVVTKFLHRRELAAVLLCITHRHVWYILEFKFHALSFHFFQPIFTISIEVAIVEGIWPICPIHTNTNSSCIDCHIVIAL